MSDTISGAGATLAIGTTAAAANQTQFEADTYQNVGLISDLGEFGDEVTPVLFTALADGRVRKARGTRDAGDLVVTYAHKPGGETGQAALAAADGASQGADEFNFRVQFDDQITPSTGNPTTFYFRGKVMGRRTQQVSPDDTVTRQVTIGINSALIEVDAA